MASRTGRRNRPRSRRAMASLQAGDSGDGGQMPQPNGWSSRATEQAARPPQQDRQRQDIDEKGTEFGDQIFRGCVSDANQERREKRPADAAEPADSDDDQKIDEVLQGVTGIDGQEIGPQSATQAGQSAAKSESRHEQSRR